MLSASHTAGRPPRTEVLPARRGPQCLGAFSIHYLWWGPHPCFPPGTLSPIGLCPHSTGGPQRHAAGRGVTVRRSCRPWGAGFGFVVLSVTAVYVCP